MIFSLRRKHQTTAQPSCAWRATTSRFARRALVLLTGFLAVPALAQSPYQPNRPAADSSAAPAAVAVQNKNAAVPTFTFQRPEAPVQQEVKQVVVTPVAMPEQPAVVTVALPAPTIPTIVFQAAAPEAPQRVQPVAVQPATGGYNTSTRAPRITAPMMQQFMIRQEVPATPVVQVQGLNQDPAEAPSVDGVTLRDLGIETEPPKADRLYRLESEAELRKRIADERRARPAKGIEAQSDVDFPVYHALSDRAYEARAYAGIAKQIEPNYVIYGRLYGEEINAERYGWDMGAIQPFWSAGVAFKDMALIPYNFAARPCQCYETSAGKCYPGDPVPYMFYPLELSATGSAWETVWILGLIAIIP